jgi:hypothetical protein
MCRVTDKAPCFLSLIPNTRLGQIGLIVANTVAYYIIPQAIVTHYKL